MIIHHPEIESQNGEVTVSVRIETSTNIAGFPEKFWYSFPQIWQKYVSPRSDAFALSMLPLAMVFNESLNIKGTTSAMLAYGLQEYQAIFHLWYPKIYNLIDVQYENMQGRNAESMNFNRAIGCSFSGGVDSMFTLGHHLSPRIINEDFKITHLVNIYGQNNDFRIRQSVKAITQNLRSLADQLELEFVEATCNMRDFQPWASLMQIYQATLLGVPLVLGELFQRYYLPSDGYTGSRLAKRGSSPVLDHFASTETMTFIHHGWAYSRIEKIKQLANWDIARNNLRVCDDPHTPTQAYNCCACEKCTHTMNIILAVSDLKKFPTFKPTISLRNYLNWGLHYEGETRSIKDPQFAFIQYKKYQYLPLLWFTHIVAKLKMLVSKILPASIKNQVKKLFYPYLRQKGNH